MSFVISGSGNLSGAVAGVPSIWILPTDPWTRGVPQPSEAVNLFASAAQVIGAVRLAKQPAPFGADLWYWVAEGDSVVAGVGLIRPTSRLSISGLSGFAVGD